MADLLDFVAWRARRDAEARSAAKSAAPAMPAGFKYTEDQATALHLLGGPARHVMLYGGSRSGKTFLICTAIVARALKAPGSRHAIFRHRFNHLKVSVGLDTLPAVFAKRFPSVDYKLDKSDWVFCLGPSEIWLGGLDEKERTEKILGQEHATIFMNECSQISYSAVLTARTRLAEKTTLVNRAFYDCNPPGSKHWTAQIFVAKKDPSSRPAGAPLPNPDNYAAMVLNPYGNRENLPAEYIADLEALPERQRQRFLLGRFSADLDNALWSLESFRHVPRIDPAECQRIVVAVDPSGASGPEDKRSDEIGIIVAARLTSKRYAVLADRTIRGAPHQWARAVIKAYRDYGADRIICERNFGGAMVMATLKAEDRSAPVKEITASRGKVVRAEPISALYAAGEVDHVAQFDNLPKADFGELEDQCCNMTSAGYMGDRSPDRADALVYALSELSGPPKTAFLIGGGLRPPAKLWPEGSRHRGHVP
jgi:Terminase RNaseH-like domain/Terminase large subunit, T4likevirus-type, N-terminal